MVRNVFVPYAVFLNNWEKIGRWTLQLRPAKHQNSAPEWSPTALQPWNLWYLCRNPPKQPSAFLQGLIHPP